VRRDVRMIHEPMRAHARSLLTGCVLAVVGVAACVIFGFLRPGGGHGDAAIGMIKDSGALYVRVGDTWHPVMNLSSARLIVGAPAETDLVSETELRKTKRGPLLGIPGAPAVIPEAMPTVESQWAVCDDNAGTTVVAGRLDEGAQPLTSGRTVLARSRSDRQTYLLYEGRRSKVSLSEAAVVRALHLESNESIEVSPSVLNAIPEAPPITAPVIPGAGGRGPATLDGALVGSVVRVVRADVDELYVVLGTGVQRVGHVAADIVRFSDSYGAADIMTVTADAISATPSVEILPVASFPAIVSAPRHQPALCAQWAPASEGGKDGNITVLTGQRVPLSAGQIAVRLAQADGTGPNADSVYIPPGRCLYVESTYRYLVIDTGVRFGVPATEAAAALGLPPQPVAAPWPIVKLLAEGPELSRANALVAHDGVAPDPRAVVLPGATGATPPR
jgi:type VII secretion protein EccB